MHVLFVTSEIAGVFKKGGLGDVSYSLPVALTKIGIRVTVVLPYYADIDSVGVKGFGNLSVNFNDKQETVFIFRKKMGHTDVEMLLLRHPKLNVYGGSPIEETFSFYSQAVASLYNASGRLFDQPVDIVHCHDWHTALVPILIGENNKFHSTSQSIQSGNVATIITIHNLMYQGVVSDSIINRLHAPRDLFHIHTSPHGNSVSLLREGFEYADMVTTVSPTYAREITAGSHHDALGDSLIRRKNEVVGIVNGIDTDVWNPGTDSTLPYMYTRETVHAVKPKIKKSLQKLFRIPTNNSLLLGFVGRIEPRQKGIDIVIEAIKLFVDDRKIQMVFLGTGDTQTVAELAGLAKKYPHSVSFMNVFDDKIARKIYAGCDVLAVPSRFEPCGLTQMIAMRYGSVPLVRKTGGLADTVKDGVTGIVFDEYSGVALKRAIERAYALWSDNPERWRDLIDTGMKQNHSWNVSAGEYRDLYRKLIR